MNTYPTPTQPQYQPPMPPPRRRMSGRKRALITIGAIFGVPVVIAFVIAMVAVVATSGPAVHRDTLPGSGTVTFTPEAVQPVNPITAAPVVPQYSIPQQQAIAAARSYLETEPGFSKAGLISQLHSKYGNGFSERLAVFAVAHVKVNWFQQAVYSAKSYMQTEPGWSYSGLVDQLHSPYGAQFTLRQAEYGAHKVGL